MKAVSTILAGVLVAASAATASAQTVGFRQNWTGRFPEANPPLAWGRTLKNSVVKGLMIQNVKPKGDAPDACARPMTDGYPDLFLVVGPFDPNDPAKALDEAFLPDESAASPDDGDKLKAPSGAEGAGDLAWKSVLMDKPLFVHTDYEPFTFAYFIGGVKKGQAGYAFTYLHSDKGGKARLMLDHTEGLRVWLNGNVVFDEPKTKVGFGFWGGQHELLNYQGPGTSPSIEVTLQKGWNRLLFKCTATAWEWARNMGFRARFIDIPPVSYDDTNISWVADLPDRSNSNPVIVGDKIFVMAERDSLVCLDKKTGKILWQRTNSYFDAVPEAEKAASPALRELEPLARKLQDSMDWNERLDLTRQINQALVKIDPAKYGMKVEAHPAGHWEITGWTTPTPCSDGRNVYVWLTQGVAACYDLNGNRKWIKRIDEFVKGPDDVWGPYMYPQGCVLVDGKFILWDREVFALNAATGEVAWRQKAALGLGVQPAAFNGEPAIIGNYSVLRVSDGKLLWTGPKGGPCGAGSYADGLLFIPGESVSVFDFTAAEGGELKPRGRGDAVVSREQNKHKASVFFKEGAWKDIYIFTSPLIHDGLGYQVDSDGTLYVVDLETGRLVYRKLLDLDPLVSVRACGVCSAVTLAGKYIYIMDNGGTTLIMEPGREFRQVARNKIETFMDRPNTGKGWQEWGPFGAPVFEGGRMYVRMERHLYCIGK